jgi:hypothetical protein
VPSTFICHASEDKAAIARPLALALRERHVEVWYDEFSLNVGDSLRETIDEGLARSDFGIVIVSPAFFRKRWTRRELGGLVAREMAGTRNIVLPVWHDIDRDEVISHSPPLADIFATSSNLGLEAVVESLLKTVRPIESPLVVARDYLISLGIDTPSIADNWWIDLAELKQSIFTDPDGSQRWIFPLPFGRERNTHEKGLNLASTTLQLDWCYAAEEQGLCQLTRPDAIHDFLRSMPGMIETVRQSPGTLAMYAPQLTLPGFDQGLADVFDALLDKPRKDAYESIGYGGWGTVDGAAPACGELIAWRHPELGNLTKRHLAFSFVHAHDYHYSRRSHSTFDCLAWLLADDSAWLPARIAQPLKEGFREGGMWFRDPNDMNNPFVAALYKHSSKGFRLTRTVQQGAHELFAGAASRLGLETPAQTIAVRFFESGFIEAYYSWEDARTATRRR